VSTTALLPYVENLKSKPNRIRVGTVNGTILSQPKSGRLARFRHIGTCGYWSQASGSRMLRSLSQGKTGFDGWQALKSGADAMTDEPKQTTPRPILSSISAQLFVANIKSSCDFYTNKLGFAVEFIYGDPPYYGQVIRDNARLALRLVFEPVFAGDVRQREHLLSASITVATANEIKQLFLSYQAAGVSFHQALKKEPWGARIFIVSDPDENLILFAAPEAD
jgi:uncharacterized glyoxalase superfamily protein PhnB